jgi:hypothetical protein
MAYMHTSIALVKIQSKYQKQNEGSELFGIKTLQRILQFQNPTGYFALL